MEGTEPHEEHVRCAYEFLDLFYLYDEVMFQHCSYREGLTEFHRNIAISFFKDVRDHQVLLDGLLANHAGYQHEIEERMRAADLVSS
jgi:hypothetical protein